MASETKAIKAVSQSPIAMRQDASAEDRADGCRVSALDESLDVGIATMTRQQRRGNQYQQKRRQEDADGRNHGAPEAGDEIADESRGDNDWARTDHADRDRDQELALNLAAGPVIADQLVAQLRMARRVLLVELVYENLRCRTSMQPLSFGIICIWQRDGQAIEQESRTSTLHAIRSPDDHSSEHIAARHRN
jgi:hypothetical protein